MISKKEFIKILERYISDFEDTCKRDISGYEQSHNFLSTKPYLDIYYNYQNNSKQLTQNKIIENINGEIYWKLIFLFFKETTGPLPKYLKNCSLKIFSELQSVVYIFYSCDDEPENFKDIPEGISKIKVVIWGESVPNIEMGYNFYRKTDIIEIITLKQFFIEYFQDIEYYNIYLNLTKKSINKINNLINSDTIPILNGNFLLYYKDALQKIILEKTKEINNYQIINNENIKRYQNLHIDSNRLSSSKEIETNYINNKKFQVLIGSNDFAKSYITSEYLYNNFNENSIFDYTAIVSGYLKSVEQLLYQLILNYIDQDNLFITSVSIIDKKNKNGKHICYYSNITKQVINDNDCIHPKNQKVQIKLFSVYKDKGYFDITLGSLSYFIRNNTNVLKNEKNKYILYNCLSCYAKECRNGFLHQNNIDGWKDVERIRNNTYFLYKCILSSFILNNINDQSSEKNIIYNEICKIIVKPFLFYNIYVFIYDNKIIYCRNENNNKDLECDKNGNVVNNLSFKEININTRKSTEKTITIGKNNLPDTIYIDLGYDDKHSYKKIYENKTVFSLKEKGPTYSTIEK